jgi:DNA adenine methylase
MTMSIIARFTMSINDTVGAREVTSRFDIGTADTTWPMSTASIGGGRRVTELIITNRV